MISDSLRHSIESLTDFDQSNIHKIYDEVAGDYDNMMQFMGSPDPSQCADLVKRLFPSKEDVSILDMGCGTGLVASELLARGFYQSQLVGLDASRGMLDVAKSKSLYMEYVHTFLGRPQNFPPFLKDRFGIVIATGILEEGHLGPIVFMEMLMATKIGGYVIFTTREAYLEKLGYMASIKNLEKSNAWIKVSESSFRRYYNIEEGSAIGGFWPVDAVILAYQKL